jgi:hypothetical protein
VGATSAYESVWLSTSRGPDAGTGGDCLLEAISHGGLGRRGERAVDHDEPGDLRMPRREPGRERRAHREPGHDDEVRSRRELAVDQLDGLQPVGERRRGHVFDGRAVAREPGQLDREAGSAEGFCQGAHRLRCAREAVHDQDPVRPPVDGERLRPRHHVHVRNLGPAG